MQGTILASLLLAMQHKGLILQVSHCMARLALHVFCSACESVASPTYEKPVLRNMLQWHVILLSAAAEVP